MISGILKAIGSALSIFNRVGKRRDRSEAENVGALKQREADREHNEEERREQIDEAVNRRPGDARDRMYDRTF